MKITLQIAIGICLLAAALDLYIGEVFLGIIMLGFAFVNYYNLKIYEKRQKNKEIIERRIKEVTQKIEETIKQQKVDELYPKDNVVDITKFTKNDSEKSE